MSSIIETNPTTAAERLELRNRRLLLKSAEEKLRNGKRTTKSEDAAFARADREAKRKQELPYMRRMPKGEYVELFGGSFKVYIEWHDRFGFPWPETGRYVDAIAAQCWYRQYVAGEVDATTVDGAESWAQRKERYQALTAETTYREMIRELIPAIEVAEVFGEIAREFSAALNVAHRISPDACERIIVALESAKEKLASRFNGHTNGQTTEAETSDKPSAAHAGGGADSKEASRTCREACESSVRVIAALAQLPRDEVSAALARLEKSGDIHSERVGTRRVFVATDYYL